MRQIEMLQDQLYWLLQSNRERNKIVIDDVVEEIKLSEMDFFKGLSNIKLSKGNLYFNGSRDGKNWDIYRVKIFDYSLQLPGFNE